jgi:hypothetical protein
MKQKKKASYNQQPLHEFFFRYMIIKEIKNQNLIYWKYEKI